MVDQLSPSDAKTSGVGWLPKSGVLVAKPGTHFHIVRIAGELGARIADELCTSGDAGPILRQLLGADVTYFVVKPGTEGLRWPAGVRELRREETVRLPALAAEDEQVAWLSHPTAETPFVSRSALRTMLCRATGWSPLGAS